MHSDRTDADLWRAIAAGEADAFGDIFLRHASTIYNFCGRRIADWTVAEDLTSAVFLEAWRRRSEVRLSGTSALPWLYGVANNLLRNHRRSARRLSSMRSRLPPPRDAPGVADEVTQRLDDEERMRQILTVIEQLREEDQQVLALCVWEELSYEEAATALDVPVGTIRSRLSRARARLRELDDGDGHEGGVTTVSLQERRGAP